MAKQLTERFIRTAKPGRHTDLFGLSLLVAAGGSKQWIWRGTVKGTGQRVVVSLGNVDLYTLDEIREIAIKFKRQARQGIDPRGEASESAAMPTLADAIGRVIEIKESEWKNAPKTRAL